MTPFPGSPFSAVHTSRRYRPNASGCCARGTRGVSRSATATPTTAKRMTTPHSCPDTDLTARSPFPTRRRLRRPSRDALGGVLVHRRRDCAARGHGEVRDSADQDVVGAPLAREQRGQLARELTASGAEV